jgi:hypothetical protein
MSEFLAVVRDVVSGALPIVAIPGFIVWLWRRRKHVEVSYIDRDGVHTEQVPIVGEIDNDGRVKYN